MAAIEQILEALHGVEQNKQFQKLFPNAHLLNPSEDVAQVRSDLPTTLLPFMTHRQPSCLDVYAIDLSDSSQNRIVVWCDHAIVAEWQNLEAFVNWIRHSGSDA